MEQEDTPLQSGPSTNLKVEMELLFPNVSNRIRQNWLELVPLILAAARLMKNKKIDALLKAPRFEKIKDDFGQ